MNIYYENRLYTEKNNKNIPLVKSPEDEYFDALGSDTKDTNRIRHECMVLLTEFVLYEMLGEKEREYLLLNKVKGFSMVEIAKAQNVNPSTVTRAIQAAQKKFDKVYDFFEKNKK